MTNDEQLLAELRDALLTAQQVPPEFVAAGKAAFAWRTVDAELAALSYDSTTAEDLADTRTEYAGVRALSFRASDVSIELEVTSDAVLGQLVPPRAGQIEVQTQDGARQQVTADETGWFTIRPLPRTSFRLQVRTAGANLITEWVTL